MNGRVCVEFSPSEIKHRAFTQTTAACALYCDSMDHEMRQFMADGYGELQHLLCQELQRLQGNRLPIARRRRSSRADLWR